MSALPENFKEPTMVTVELTPEEAHELFSRCLHDMQDDSELSRTVLQKLAKALYSSGS